MKTLIALTILLSCSLAAAAQSPPAPQSSLADVRMQTHDGRDVRLVSDLLTGHVTAIQFIFTSCTTVCPMMGVRFAQLQEQLGEDSTRVTLLSVSIDPATDTPARLAEWGKRFGAREGWTLVTGAPADVDTLLASLGASSSAPAAHTPLILIVDGRDGRMSLERVDGLTDARTLAARLHTLVHPR